MTSTELSQAEAIEQARPLTATQAKAALKVIENDYDQLAADIQAAGAERIAAVTEEVQARYRVDGLDLAESWDRKARRLEQKYMQKREALKRDASDVGVRVEAAPIETYRRVSAKVIGEGREIEAAVAGIRADMAAALAQVRRDRIAAERTVHVATLTAVAEQIVTNIPSAAEMFVRAMQERQAREAAMLQITEGSQDQ